MDGVTANGEHICRPVWDSYWGAAAEADGRWWWKRKEEEEECEWCIIFFFFFVVVDGIAWELRGDGAREWRCSGVASAVRVCR